VASSLAPDLIARLEALPFSRWHVRARIIVGSATFFDAFGALSLAFVLPVLVRLWGITPAQIGWLIATGYLGQFVGALVFGALYHIPHYTVVKPDSFWMAFIWGGAFTHYFLDSKIWRVRRDAQLNDNLRMARAEVA